MDIEGFKGNTISKKLGEVSYRNKDYLNILDNINILNKYFYISPDNKVTVSNGIANLTIRMVLLESPSRGLVTRFKALNGNFPDLPEMDYTDSMTLDTMEAIIEQLKKQEPLEIKSFSNRWEEIKTITLTNCSLNQL